MLPIHCNKVAKVLDRLEKYQGLYKTKIKTMEETIKRREENIIQENNINKNV